MAMPTSPTSTPLQKRSRSTWTGFTVVVTKSTVPVGTGDEVEEIIRKTNPNAKFAVVSNPEFLREGAAIGDFKRPDRVVVGVDRLAKKASVPVKSCANSIARCS